jgi:NAD(P)-dependent dehydrogenase (short-subunit alcohol dehydrogenase family)
LSEGTPPRGRPAPFGLEGVPPEVIGAYRLDRLPLDRPRRAMADLLRLDGKVALVTGSGGQGLGNAIAHRLAEAGASVAVLDVDAQAASAAADELSGTWGVAARPFVANVGDWAQAHQAVQAVVDQWGTVDVLVNNAGGSGSVGTDGRTLQGSGSFASLSKEDIDLTVTVNLTGVMYMTRAVLGPMLSRRSGRIINISSEGGKIGMAGGVPYNSCKAALIGFTRNLAHEVGPEGISVVALCPGVMVTERLVRRGAFPASSDGSFAALLRRTTLGRFSIPDEVASAVAFLASEAGSYIHGTAVSVGGGLAD